jgi:branched-subunit amino acid aminotransferase/4-amino-4-deoxychorismate lyase
MTTGPGEFAPWLGVFETVRVIEGVPLFATAHRDELERAAHALGLKPAFDLDQERKKLPPLSGRWRWIVTLPETRTLFTAEEQTILEPVALSVSPVRVGSHNWDARFKTISYLSHAQAWKTASTPDAVLMNETGHVASGARSNIFWRRGDRLFTPAHEAGCRCGVVRGFVLQSREVETGHFPLSDLLEADEIFLTNSMKGIVSVDAVEGRELSAFACAEELRRGYEAAAQAQTSRPD